MKFNEEQAVRITNRLFFAAAIVMIIVLAIHICIKYFER